MLLMYYLSEKAVPRLCTSIGTSGQNIVISTHTGYNPLSYATPNQICNTVPSQSTRGTRAYAVVYHPLNV